MNLYGKDKDDNIVTLQEVLENNERNIEEIIDIKMKKKQIRMILQLIKLYMSPNLILKKLKN